MLHWYSYQDHFFDDAMNSIWNEDRTISYWLTLEKIIAKKQAELGLISTETIPYLENIELNDLDKQALYDDMQLAGRPIIGLVKQLRAKLPEHLQTHVHFGITTQDIMDTCTCLQIKESITQIENTANLIIDKIEQLKISTRDLTTIARTNGQYALPIKLSQKFNVWQQELCRRIDSIQHAKNQYLWLQLSGAVGDSKQLGKSAKELRIKVAKELDLTLVEPHWQNTRDGIAEIISSVGLLCSTLTKIAHNINLLSSSDIAEFQEAISLGKGASSTMPHKKNQRYSEFAESIARLGRQHAEQFNELTLHQHERYGGVWISEWYLVPQVFRFTSGALKWTEKAFSSLEVNEDSIQANLNKFSDSCQL